MPDAEQRSKSADTRPISGGRGVADRLVSGLAIVAALLILADAFYDKHAKFALEGLFGFYGLFGFVACVVVVVLARTMLRPLRRPDDHYERDAGDGV